MAFVAKGRARCPITLWTFNLKDEHQMCACLVKLLSEFKSLKSQFLCKFIELDYSNFMEPI